MTGASNNGGEDGPGGVITGETSLAHAGAIVNDKSSNVLVTHLGMVAYGLGIPKSEHTQRPEICVKLESSDLAFYTPAANPAKHC